MGKDYDFELHSVRPSRVIRTLARYIQVEGFHLVVDLERSRGSYMVCADSGRKYLDMYSYFSTLPLGHNHPKMRDREFLKELKLASLENPANSDVYTESYAGFVKTFARIAKPPFMRHLFFIAGGALAVENALKVAFDWKARKEKRSPGYCGQQVIHFRNAFHGRSGYTLSLTNTSPAKTMYFPKFRWPRVACPRLSFPVTPRVLGDVKAAEARAFRQIKSVIKRKGRDIACLIIEPIQGEGGDNHFRGEFLQGLEEICRKNDIMFILDEVQTGLGTTGRMWAFEHFDLRPDIVAFGKKAQVCGIMCSDRVDEVRDNVFDVRSRINSTWGGSLADMVTCRRYLEIMREERLIENADGVGAYFLKRLEELQDRHEAMSNARGKGCFLAFDLPTPKERDSFVNRCWKNRLAVLSSWPKSVRFRPPLNLSKDEVDEAIEKLERSFRGKVKRVQRFSEST